MCCTIIFLGFMHAKKLNAEENTEASNIETSYSKNREKRTCIMRIHQSQPLEF